MSNQKGLLRTTMLVGAVGAAFMIAHQASAADMAVKAPPPSTGCVQAVDGVNGKVGAFGGSADNHPYAGTEGSVSIPLGCEVGAQIDGLGSSFDNRYFGGVAGHLFMRNPAQGLLGAYGDYVKWDQFGGVYTAHVGAEAEMYSGQWTLRGLAGAEQGSNQSVVVGSVIQNFNTPTRFFDQINLAFYPTDNLEVFAGQRYLGGKNAAAFGGEWGLPWGKGVMASLFTEGLIGQDSFHGGWVGLRFYFGQKDKTLIRRHREDDPTNWDTDSLFGITNSNSQSPLPPSPPPCMGDGCGM
jgi:hypothetical protein